MNTTVGFVPSPAFPLVPVAAKAVAPAGGALLGVVGAVGGGLLLGPAGVAGGLALGLLAAELLAPARTAGGLSELPPMLDPSLNAADPVPDREGGYRPIIKWVPSGADPEGIGELSTFHIDYTVVDTAFSTYRCSWPEGPPLDYPHRSTEYVQEVRNAVNIRITSDRVVSEPVCEGGANILKTVFQIEKLTPAGVWENHFHFTRYDGTYNYTENLIGEAPVTTAYLTHVWANRVNINTDFPVQEVEPDTTPSPRPSPVPLRPIPAPAPQPATVPLPSPEPQPEPLIVPSPADPDAAPIEIPKAPPAEPQPVPGPDSDPLPATVPIGPDPVNPPLPVPGVPQLPEPSPDPSVIPAPGPAPNPVPFPDPGPAPSPEPAPGPGISPSPSPVPTPLPVPSPDPLVPTPTPDSPIGTLPDGSLAALPAAAIAVTNKDAHFPVSGGPAVLPAGARADIAAISKEVGRIEQKTAGLMNGVGLGDLLLLLGQLEELLGGGDPGTTYQLQGVCEAVSDGEEQPVLDVPIAPASQMQGIINRLDALPVLLQQHLAWRTPICGQRERIEQLGDFRTLTFISDERSPVGKSRLIKRMRYRSQSGLGLGEIVDHWAGFTWTSGPIVVKHRDSWWGQPQVWASSIDEGKRVIRHAAGEAGLDPDQVGRWEVGGSRNPRYGMPGTMRIRTDGGYYWITARDGSDERPIVVKT